MHRVLRGRPAALAACALALALAGPARCADDPRPAPAPAADQKVYDLLRDVINEGARLYNQGDYAGCYRLWEGSLLALRPMLDGHAEWQKAIDIAQTEARTQPEMWERAWTLRRAMDRIRADVHPPRTGGATAEQPAAGTPGTRGAATLWDRLGGERGVRKVVDDLTYVMAKDPRVDLTRGGKYTLTDRDIARFKDEMVAWVSSKTGGPLKYTGENMKKTHEGMGITDAQFDAAVTDLEAVLDKNGVRGEDAKAVLQAVEATRSDIVGKKSGEAKGGGKKAEATVRGHVTYEGQPLPGGTITLTAKDGTVASGAIAADGTYAVEGVKPGAYTVTVTASGDKDKGVSKIPEKYADPTKSGLTFEVKEGQNTLDLDLRK